MTVDYIELSVSVRCGLCLASFQLFNICCSYNYRRIQGDRDASPTRPNVFFFAYSGYSRRNCRRHWLSAMQKYSTFGGLHSENL